MTAISFLFLCSVTHTAAQGSSAGYNQPPKNILDVMRAPAPASPVVSPTRDSILLVTPQDYPSIARVATPFLRLAGVRVETRNHSRHDTPGGYGITACEVSYELVQVADGAKKPVALPKDACAGSPDWSTDGKHFAFANTTADAVELWVGDAKTATVRQIAGLRLNPMFDDELGWMPDQKHLLVKLIPEDLGAAPIKPEVPLGPSIQQTDGRSGQSSTYENRDTLSSPYDESVFDYYGTSQLALVDVATGTVTKIGKPALYYSLEPAPDNQHILVSYLHKPYSYVTTYNRFPRTVEVWDVAEPAQVKTQAIASLPLADRVPIQGVPLGPRSFSWRATDPATLLWAEALDGGDWNVTVPNRDKVMQLKAPFTDQPTELIKTEQRYGGFAWSDEASLTLLYEYDENKHWERTWIVDVEHAGSKPKLLWDRSSDEHYADPGSPVLKRLPNGFSILRREGDSIYLRGTGGSPDGDRPFLDRLNLKTLVTERLFRSEKTSYEQFVAFADESSTKFITWHQSPIDPPNAWMRTLGKQAKAEAGEAQYSSTSVAITHIPDPAPEVRAIHKRLVKYKRADGLDLSFTLYTPPGYKEGTRVPAILYAYPLDYADASKAGQVSGSQMTFTRLRQYRLLLLAGYAIIDNAAFPIVGDPKNAYDHYMEQLTADAKAAVDEAVRLGVADPDRIGVTGHSHGALMTVNLLAHTDLFRAGAATSGSYNKTLTPFGFQNERRSVWQAPEVYKEVSPFFFADKLKTPVLIVHGDEDANPGTTPLQASKLYEAIRGNGGTARLVLLPHEPHWYTARESNEQLIYEMVTWFDKYVKNAPPRAAAK
ncbi:MAG: prolyl oligopeptidase family serine peptidase [Terracidiphilus sp.]|nr:prolyl oligopeptidase family serine peptidase [Terracidiphilus sp.]